MKNPFVPLNQKLKGDFIFRVLIVCVFEIIFSISKERLKFKYLEKV